MVPKYGRLPKVSAGEQHPLLLVTSLSECSAATAATDTSAARACQWQSTGWYSSAFPFSVGTILSSTLPAFSYPHVQKLILCEFFFHLPTYRIPFSYYTVLCYFLGHRMNSFLDFLPKLKPRNDCSLFALCSIIFFDGFLRYDPLC